MELQAAPERVRIPREDVAERVQELQDEFSRRLPNVPVYIAGSWRRNTPTVKDLDVVVVTSTGTLKGLDLPVDTSVRGDKVSGGQYHGLHVDVWACRPDQLGAFLVFTTGPARLNLAMRSSAQSRGWKLSRYGLFDQCGARLDDSTEAGLFAALHDPTFHGLEDPEARRAYEAPEQTWQVQGRSGTYTVTLSATGTWSCSCPNGTYRPRSRDKHVEQVKASLVTQGN